MALLGAVGLGLLLFVQDLSKFAVVHENNLGCGELNP